jgi:hypothetical protein
MLNLTRKALEEFDNSHDFERMAADILNALGYGQVEPMAPAGGGDSGQDIRYADGGAIGVAFVTLEKKIKAKFSRDLTKVRQGEAAALSLFCNVEISPGLKLELSQLARARDDRDLLRQVDRQHELVALDIHGDVLHPASPCPSHIDRAHCATPPACSIRALASA